MEYRPLKKAILAKLKRELPKEYTYHNLGHTKDVLNISIALGRLENLGSSDLTLLKTAALFHDAGYIFGAENHENRSCEIAKEFLPEYGYSDVEIQTVCTTIMATKIPQNPQNHLGEILADADLDYLGRSDFFKISELLYLEFLVSGKVQNEAEWNRIQIKFFEAHHYFTAASQKLRLEGKLKNLKEIKSKL